MTLARSLLLLLLLRLAFTHEATPDKKHYIVYMGDLTHDKDFTIFANSEILATVIGSVAEAQSALIHHYSKSFRGFSANLTPEQAQQLENSEQVISVFQSRLLSLQTTRSWDFLKVGSIPENDAQPMHPQSDVIVGMIDSGIWPESQSFTDRDLGQVPENFKGECMTGDHFNSTNCNRKIIGAKFYYKGFEADYGKLDSFNETFFRSPRDSYGHGTHTSSTVAGSAVANVSVFGMGKGTARGGALNARLSIYKVCWVLGQCSGADILKAMDDAIADRVHIISASLGGMPVPYLTDVLAIGALHAFQNGIIVSTVAGNDFFPGTVVNLAPWVVTVAATTIDREFITSIILGSSEVIKGSSLNRMEMEGPLIHGSDAHAPGVSRSNASTCMDGTLDPSKIQGKIVVCTTQDLDDDGAEKHFTVKQGGGHGTILIDPILKEIGLLYQYPTAVIDQIEAERLNKYMATEKNPNATICKTETLLNTKPAPRVAAFSSRGPNILNPEIIKPDIAAPGENILAAWSPASISETVEESLEYNIVSGTSMSCPHITAILAVLKSEQPSWSPAALKSALMTTATVVDNSQGPITTSLNGSTRATPFDFGSGQVNAISARNPGLVYEYDLHDILHFLCSLDTSLRELTTLRRGKPAQCTADIPSYNLNYPSIGVYNINGSVTVTRTVTYYASGKTTYVAFLEPPVGVNVTVMPTTLEFENSGEKKSFSVHFVPVKIIKNEFSFGALTWSNGIHIVRSPMALNFNSL